jgi:anaerobic selenocysteine-containing dehydrogenase
MTVTDRHDSTHVHHTVCTLDCPDACSLAVTVTEGRIVNVDASPVNDFTDGWICSKVKRTAARVYAPERLTTPLVRTGPKGTASFRHATWDEALQLVVGSIRHSVARRGNADGVVAFTYNSSAAAIERNSMSEAFFAAIGATRVDHTICAEINGVAWSSVFGTMSSADPRDVVHSQLVVVWGANPTVSNTHFPPLVNTARQQGARVVVIDPRRTAMARRADLHVAVLPGTDVVLALAVANLWAERGGIDTEFAHTHADGVEEFLAAAARWPVDRAAVTCGVAEADIVTLAEWWAASRPSMLRVGWGLERNSNGGSGIRAVLALQVLGGHFGVAGSGVIGGVSAGAIRPAARWPSFEPIDRRHLAMHQLGEWMSPHSDGGCDVLFIQGSNPAVMCPDQSAVIAALSRTDVFTVVHEQVLTDTARYADVVLPATTSFEIGGAHSSYGSYTVQPVTPVIAAVGESRSNDQLGLALAEAWGFEWADPGFAPAVPDPGPRVAKVASRQFVDTFPFDGKARLVDAHHGVPQFVPVDRPAGSLTLISPASSKLVNSIFGEFQSPSPAVVLHPADAAAAGVEAGHLVRVHNDQGSIEVLVEVNDEMRPGVALMYKGVWLRNHDDGKGVNTLTPSIGDPTCNGACFNDTFVQVTPL